MTKHEKEILKELTKEQLQQILIFHIILLIIHIVCDMGMWYNYDVWKDVMDLIFDYIYKGGK